MKSIFSRLTVFIVFVAFFAGCKDVIYENDLRNVPVYLSYEDLRSALIVQGPRPLENPGKLYFKDGYIFINEELKGIHVIDNRNPHSPENVTFIHIPGNVDMAIRVNVLYADSYVDLVAVDISNINSPVEIARVKDVFPYTLPEPKNGELLIAEIDENKGVVIDYEIDYAELQVERKSYPVYPGRWYKNEMAMDGAYFNVSSSAASPAQSIGGYTSSSQGSAFGIGGSMARFGLNQNFLYAVDAEQFHIFKLTAAGTPILENEKKAGDEVETMFIYNGHMFLGTTTGMLVYSLEEPENPMKINSYSHIRSCDPVVVQNNIAYVTLRGGNECGRAVSRLDILELSDSYRKATPLHSFPMKEPYGLGIDDEVLFVCDGKDGLLVYDASNLATLYHKKLAQFPNIDAFDVIPFNDFLFMIGKDGFYQYDYSDLQDIRQISRIPVE